MRLKVENLGEVSKRKRPGIHSKKKNSATKTSKNYVKRYKGQGR
jgi:hypothetical protein